MKTRYYNRLLRSLFALMVILLMAACASDVTTDNEKPLPEGMGRIHITICTPENNPDLTRAVNEDVTDPENRTHDFPWEAPDHDWEKLHTFRIFICDASNKVVQIITEGTLIDTSTDMTESKYKWYEATSQPLDAGTYKIYATANYDDNYTVGSTINLDETVKFTNGYSETNIPMTGKLTNTDGSIKTVTVTNGHQTDAGTITVWRVMAKMQFEFTNESNTKVRIIGIEVDPINLASEEGPGIYLFSKDDLESTANLAPGVTPPSGHEGLTLPPKGSNAKSAREDVGTFRYQPTAIPLTLNANGQDGSTGNIFFYVNESDGTFTTTQNQYSLRFKVQRLKEGKTGNNDDDWYEQEIRYGVTTHHDLSNSGTYGGNKGGFNVIRRNDWIHIPIHLTDWQFRIEPIAFVPIGGYPAITVSSDALTATFSTGGMIALQPYIKKYNDTSWRDFSAPQITYGNESWAASIHWKNSDGEDIAYFNSDGSYKDGSNPYVLNTPTGKKIVKTAFAYDPDTGYIIGELENNLAGRGGPKMTTLTVCLKLGPSDDATQQYIYTFTFNIILE